MNVHHRKLALAAVLVCLAPASLQGAAADTRKDWPMVAGDLGGGRYSPLDQINASNVARLGGAWQHTFKGLPSRATPVVVGGRMYVTAGTRVFALDAATGAQLWEHAGQASVLFKGVAVGEGLVFYGTTDAHLIALDAATGAERWRTLAGDRIAPRKDMPLAYITTTGQTITAAPTYAGSIVLAGISGGDWGHRGRVVAVDAASGKKLWTFFAVPGPGEYGHDTWPQNSDAWKRGGGAVWATINVDPDLGLAYFVVGNPVPQWGGEARAGANLFTDSIVAVDLKSGKYRWHYQLVHHDIWEADIGTPPVFYDATVAGKAVKAVAVMRTDGFMFLFDRATGTPIHAVEERPVPQNAKLKTHPTQPFPVGADQFGPNCVQNGQVPEGFRRLCAYDPVDATMPNAIYPLMNARSSPMSYHPGTKMLVVTGTRVWPLWIRRFEDPHFFQLIGAAIPGQKVSGGLIAAFDSRTNKIVWQKETPYEMHNSSGATTTAGGLVFYGLADGNFEAMDVRNGEVLWRFQTGGNATGPAAVYEIGGEQYVATISTTEMWAFKLGGKLAPLPTPPPPPRERGFSGRVVPTDRVDMGAVIEDTGLEKVRTVFDEHAFAPSRISVGAGDTVTWTNKGKTPHTAVAVDGSWTTGAVAPGKSAVVTFPKPGAYTYYCDDHPWSFGQVLVE